MNKNAQRILTRLRAEDAEEPRSLLTKSEIAAIRASVPAERPCPSRKEQFLVMVFSGALMRDINGNTNDAQVVARAALEIDEKKIPPNVDAAAASFLNYFYSGQARGFPHKWMMIGAENAMENLAG